MNTQPSTIPDPPRQRSELSEQDSDALVASMLDLASTLKGPERASFIAKMVNTARRISPHGEFPTDPRKYQLFRTALRVLGQVQGHPRMTPNGVLYRGRPSFVTDELLAGLLHEARTDARQRAIWQRGHLLGVGGTLGEQIANGDALRGLVEELAGPVDATGVVSYLFYEEEGSGIPAHVDTEVFSINVNLILHRSHTGTQTSRLFLYHTDGRTKEEMFLQPGEMIITFGDSVFHGRTKLSAGEVITNFTVGFQPTAWEDD